MKTKGPAFIILSLAITAILWICSKWYFGDWFADQYKYVAKISALLATIMFSWSMILSARIHFIEKWFGGLDKVYTAHKWLGIAGFWLIFLHPLFLGVHKLPDLFAFVAYYYFRPLDTIKHIGFNLGISAFLLLVSLILLIRNSKVPYHIWKKTHEFMTVFYFAVVLHILLVTADISKYPLLGAWMYSWFAFSLFCGIYKNLLYGKFGPKFEYQIIGIEKFPDLVEIDLQPVADKKICHKPGQFAFVRFLNTHFNDEVHPYSIASAPNFEGSIRLGIKVLGDDTKNIVHLKVGEKALIYGPYGNTSEKFLQAKRDCVCIGGGIGITPFLGIWDMALNSDERVDLDASYELKRFDENSVKTWKSPRIHLFYSVKNIDDAVFNDNIQDSVIRSKFNGFGDYTSRGHSYTLHNVETDGYLTVSMLEKKIGNLSDKWFMLCGPKAMSSSIISQLKAKGVKNSQIVFEDFEMREVDTSWIYRLFGINR